MSHLRDIAPAGHVEHAADPPTRPVALACQPPQQCMDGNQIAQGLSAQAGNIAGGLQHNVRALMVRANSPTPVSDGHDEVAGLRKQLQHQQQAPREMKSVLKTKLWQSRLSRANGKWLVKKHMRLEPELAQSQRTLRRQRCRLYNDFKIVFSINAMVNFDAVVTSITCSCITRRMSRSC